MSLLIVNRVSSGYRGDLICRDVDITVEANEVVCILGRNGVGKTTLLKTILGIVRRQSGEITLDGIEIGRLGPNRIARSGIGYVPQGRRLFGHLTVRDNLRLGSVGALGHLAMPADDVMDLFPILRERLDQRASTLSGGEQQMVAIARALAARPRLLLCDEPTEGLQPSMVSHVEHSLRTAAIELGSAILLVEQNIRLAAALASRGYVLETGRVVEAGPVEQITADEVVERRIAFSRIRTHAGGR